MDPNYGDLFDRYGQFSSCKVITNKLTNQLKKEKINLLELEFLIFVEDPGGDLDKNVFLFHVVLRQFGKI